MDEQSRTVRRCAGVVATACTQGKRAQHGKPLGVVRNDQPNAREGGFGRSGVAERPVVPGKLGNAGGGKGPWFKIEQVDIAAHGRGPRDDHQRRCFDRRPCGHRSGPQGSRHRDGVPKICLVAALDVRVGLGEILVGRQIGAIP